MSAKWIAVTESTASTSINFNCSPSQREYSSRYFDNEMPYRYSPSKETGIAQRSALRSTGSNRLSSSAQAVRALVSRIKPSPPPLVVRIRHHPVFGFFGFPPPMPHPAETIHPWRFRFVSDPIGEFFLKHFSSTSDFRDRPSCAAVALAKRNSESGMSNVVFRAQ